MKFLSILTLILCLFITPSITAAQYAAEQIVNAQKVQVTPEQAKNIVAGLIEEAIEQKLEAAQEEPSPKGIDEELAIIQQDLAQFPEGDKEYIRYFTLYSMQHDPELVKKGYFALNFWIHSLSNQGIIRLPQLVENSHGTLFRIDIRDYGWELQSIEDVSVAEPYIREPWIDHQIYSAIRLENGNPLIRGDWFIDATSTPIKQIDNDENVLYYTLIYGQHTPKNRQEFYDFWRADIAKIEGKKSLLKDIKQQTSLVQQLLVKEGKSGVALNNRVLARAPTEFGYLWETSDFKNSNGVRDVVHNLEPGVMVHSQADAGELIVSDQNGLQKYFIVDKAGNRADVAGVDVAFDRTNPRDIRVMTGRSCVECHAAGINAANNVLANDILVSNKLKYSNYDTKIKIDTAYLATIIDRKTRQPVLKISNLIQEDSDRYDQAVFNVNGISSTENAAIFRDVLNWYNQDVTLAQAARECGVTIQEFQDKTEGSVNGFINSLRDGGTVTRQEWEASKLGLFQQTMLLLTGQKTIHQSADEISTEIPLTAPDNRVLYILVDKTTAPLKTGSKVIMNVPQNTKLQVIEKRDSWYKVKMNQNTGWLYKQDVHEVWEDK